MAGFKVELETLARATRLAVMRAARAGKASPVASRVADRIEEQCEARARSLLFCEALAAGHENPAFYADTMRAIAASL